MKFKLLFISFICTLFASWGLASNLHDQVLHTQVRVRSVDAGGSGTVIYAQKSGEFYSVYIITCYHVIEKNCKLEEKWDSLREKDRKVELRQPVVVEFFRWGSTPHGTAPLTGGAQADIVAYDEDHDMALLHLSISEKPTIAKLLPPKDRELIDIGAPVVAVGCALLHDPILTHGYITHLGDIIDYKDYVMSSAAIIFGNSGGGLFLNNSNEYFFIGIPSRVDVIGWGTVVTHLGYSSPIWRIYEFFESKIFDFLIPGSTKTEAQCNKEREELKQVEKEK